jgi:hypothetical protein
MVSEEMISTLAGVCSRERLSRLPVDAGAPRLMVGAAPKPAVDVPGGIQGSLPNCDIKLRYPSYI